MKKGQKKWSIATHVIVPLVCFAAGLFLSASLTLGSSSGLAQSDVSAQGVRLMECLGLNNDLENIKADVDRRLGALTQELERAQAELRAAKASKAAAREAAARSLSASSSHEELVVNWDKETEEEGAWAKRVAVQSPGKAAGDALQWSKFGKWQAAPLEPLSFSTRFDIGLPIDTIKWSGGNLLLPSKLASGARGSMEARGDALQHVDAQCSELDVLVLNDQHCVAVTSVNGAQTGHNTPYHITRFLKTSADLPGSAGAAWAQVSRLTSKAGANEGAPPGVHALKTHRQSLARFFQRCVRRARHVSSR